MGLGIWDIAVMRLLIAVKCGPSDQWHVSRDFLVHTRVVSMEMYDMVLECVMLLSETVYRIFILNI